MPRTAAVLMEIDEMFEVRCEPCIPSGYGPGSIKDEDVALEELRQHLRDIHGVDIAPDDGWYTFPDDAPMMIRKTAAVLEEEFGDTFKVVCQPCIPAQYGPDNIDFEQDALGELQQHLLNVHGVTIELGENRYIFPDVQDHST